MFEEFGIEVFVGAEGVRLRDVIEAWQQGRLMEATDENACKSTGIAETQPEACGTQYLRESWYLEIPLRPIS
jgi:predicted Fe-Mo cluster-binding NifX family protein